LSTRELIEKNKTKKNETAQVYALEEYVVDYQLSLDRKKFKHVATVS
jgi:hypothetical protein